jgi:hypothetical protein
VKITVKTMVNDQILIFLDHENGSTIIIIFSAHDRENQCLACCTFRNRGFERSFKPLHPPFSSTHTGIYTYLCFDRFSVAQTVKYIVVFVPIKNMKNVLSTLTCTVPDLLEQFTVST